MRGVCESILDKSLIFGSLICAVIETRVARNYHYASVKLPLHLRYPRLVQGAISVATCEHDRTEVLHVIDSPATMYALSIA
jgi:hypothetical protein